MTGATLAQHELIDVIDLLPIGGEYAGCRETSEFTEFGVTVTAFHRYHARRIAVGRRWDSCCECCGHRLRYAHVTRDEAGEFHCFGRTCLDINALGEEGARRLEYSQRIDEKENGFVATFNIPHQLWDMPREKRPHWARLWKGRAMTRRGGAQWKLSVWGNEFEECLAHCMELSALLGVKLF